jgi:hypothetical protein
MVAKPRKPGVRATPKKAPSPDVIKAVEKKAKDLERQVPGEPEVKADMFGRFLVGGKNAKRRIYQRARDGKKVKQVTIYIELETLTRFDQYLLDRADGTTRTELINAMLQDFLDRQPN